MSLIKANAVQIGQSNDATDNFTLAVPSSPDGTIKLARGNSGATTQDVMNVSNAGVVSFPQGLGNISNSTAIATGSTTARSLANRFADIYNVKDFGAVGDGVTDNQAAFQAAINTALSAGGGTIYIPKGVYNFPNTSNAPKLDPGLGNLTFKGDGDTSSILKYWEGTGNDQQSNLFKNIDNNSLKGVLNFFDLQIQGSLVGPAGTRRGRFGNPLWCDYYPEVTIRNCKFLNIAAMAMDFHYCGSFKCINSYFENIGADGIRARDTNDIIIVGNILKTIGDDAIAVHTNTNTLLSFTPQRERIIISNNTVVNCAGYIRSIGAKKTIISNNNVHLGGQIEILSNYLTAEGNNPIYDISITGNIITDAFFGWSEIPPGISVFLQNAKAGSSSNNIIPGDYDSVTGEIIYPWDYNQTSALVSSNSLPRSNGVVIANNSISRTKSATVFTDYGVGDRMWQGLIAPGVTQVYPIENLNGRGFGIHIKGNIENLSISNNIIKNCKFGILIQPDSISAISPETTSKLLKNGIINGNVIYDCVEVGIQFSLDSVGNSDLLVTNNLINCDPYRINSNSNINGTYISTTSNPIGIQAARARGCSIRNNKFKNCCTTVWTTTSDVGVCDINNNIIHCQPVSPYGGTNNKGVGQTFYNSGLISGNENGTNIFIIEDSDPTSATYLDFISKPYISSNAQPASGWYPKGWFVKNHTPTLDANGMTISGWIRLTTGTSHVAGVDWAVTRVSNVSPAV
jgi:hypothetical protein